MARGRSTGTGFAVALVIMGFLFFVSVIFAVIFYVQFNTAKVEAEQAEKQLALYVTRDQTQNVKIAALEQESSEGGQSVVGSLMAENGFLKETILGDPNAPLDNHQQRQDIISKKKADLGLSVALFNEIETLKATIDDLAKRRKNLESQLAAERSNFSKLAQARQQSQDAYNTAVAKLQGNLGQVTSDFKTNITQAESQLTDIRDDFKKQTEQYQSSSEDLEQKLAEQRDRIVQLEVINARLRDENRSRTQMSNITPKDGAIVTVSDAGDSVYINRGTKDHVLLGMTFEVFEPDELIKLDDQDQLRGKATLEVFEINDTTARARVVRKNRNTFLKEGDTIANLVYDPNKTFKFYVHGKFDLDKDGVPRKSELRRIENLIRDWGGEVVDTLDYDVDFLVLGTRPEFPAPLPPGETDLAKIEIRGEQVKEFEAYSGLEVEAKKLSIPVLNQNRFYSLIGLYEQR